MDTSFGHGFFAFPQSQPTRQNVFRQAFRNPAPRSGFPQPFSQPAAPMDDYFDDMRRALGKDNLSEADFHQYERLLTNAGDMLEDTIQFSQRASSPVTAKFEAQKADLLKKLNFTRQFSQFFQNDTKVNPFKTT